MCLRACLPTAAFVDGNVNVKVTVVLRPTVSSPGCFVVVVVVVGFEEVEEAVQVLVLSGVGPVSNEPVLRAMSAYDETKFFAALVLKCFCAGTLMTITQ